MVESGFLCLRRTQIRKRMRVTRTTAPDTGTTTYSHRLNSVHFGIPHASLGFLQTKTGFLGLFFFSSLSAAAAAAAA